MATKMKMVNKGGKMVPAFAADGKGKMKMGGSKKPLKKAQDGIVAGPFTEKTAKMLDNNYPSTSAKIPLDPFYQTNSYKKTGANRPYAVEDETFNRIDREEFQRSPKIFKKKGGATKTTYKTGGMVNANAKLQAAKSAGSKGVKSGVNPKAAASKVAKGKVGGVSKVPKAAMPEAKYGMTMKKMQDGGFLENAGNANRRVNATVQSVFNKVTGRYPAKVYNEQWNKSTGKGKYSGLSNKELNDQYKQVKPKAISSGIKNTTKKMQVGGPTGNSPENQIKRSMVKSAFNNAKAITKGRSGKPNGKI
jgi:hypothetical protein